MADLEQQLGDLVASGKIPIEDADMVREFAAFLSDPEVGPPDQPLPMSVLRRHQHVLGLTDADLADAERNRGGGGQ
jgi:hypothetical protein